LIGCQATAELLDCELEPGFHRLLV